MSQYRLAKIAGVDKGALSRFVHGQRGLMTSSVDKLADALGLELVEKKRRAI